MKKSLSSLFLAAVVSVTVVCANAAETVSEAVVLKVTGNAKATLPSGASSEIKVGDKLPQGTVIETSDGSAVDLQVFSGVKATIQPNSKLDISKLTLDSENGRVIKQTAELNLPLGTVVSSLDPSKKAINDYSIRTPKGVAAARGTLYTVTVTATGEVRTYVATGTVVFQGPNGSVTVLAGQVVTVDAEGNISEPTAATAEQRARAEQIMRETGAAAGSEIDITISPSQ